MGDRHVSLSTLDAIGIGVGPANLSLAALSFPVSDLSFRFLEQKAEFAWHPGLLFPNSMLQVSFLKDLVTLVDPTSPFSFLSFLHHHQRLYRFIIARFPSVLRKEYEEYYRWVSHSLPNIEFGTRVEAVTDEGGLFQVVTDRHRIRARHVVLGTGLIPNIPSCALAHLGETVFHAHHFLSNRRDFAGKTVALIGGGQTAAEIALNLISAPYELKCDILWITRRGNLLPLDDSPFTNEFFTPSYSNSFFMMPKASRTRLLQEQRLASDGTSESLLEDLYRTLYTMEFVEKMPRRVQLIPNAELSEVVPRAPGWELVVRDTLESRVKAFRADVVILCTGYRFCIPECMSNLKGRFAMDGNHFVVNSDFSIQWDGPEYQRVYIQNGARHARGVADPNLSLLAWRSAVILNSIASRKVYDVEDFSPFIDWAAMEETIGEPEYRPCRAHGNGHRSAASRFQGASRIASDH